MIASTDILEIKHTKGIEQWFQEAKTKHPVILRKRTQAGIGNMFSFP